MVCAALKSNDNFILVPVGLSNRSRLLTDPSYFEPVAGQEFRSTSLDGHPPWVRYEREQLRRAQRYPFGRHAATDAAAYCSSEP